MNSNKLNQILNPLLDEEKKLVSDYNSNIKMLIHILNNKHENKNKDIMEISRMMSTALSIDLNVVIEESGPYLIQHSEGLNDLDKFVTETNFDDKITSKEQDTQKLIKNIINAIKNIWNKVNEKEKGIIIQLVKNMMTEYCQYVKVKIAIKDAKAKY